MAKLNYVQSQNPQVLSYVSCRSEEKENSVKNITLEDCLGDLVLVIMTLFVMICAAIGFMVLLLMLATM